MRQFFVILTAFLTLTVVTVFGQTNKQWKTIEIGNYLFDFPPDFKLIPLKGVDSYVGEVQGDSLSFNFDVGAYSYDFSNENHYCDTIISTVDNQYRKFYFSKDPKNGKTGIHIKEMNNYSKLFQNYMGLYMSTTGLTKSQQLLAIKILSTVRHKEKK